MLTSNAIWVAQGENPCHLLLNQANRHGLITGASGTGKTITLKVLAEGFSKAGVPVFVADVKGDIAGMSCPGEVSENVQKRIDKFAIQNWSYEGCPVRLWDMLGGDGTPVRLTISQMGPVLLSRLLGLSDVQEGVLNIVFRIADDKQWLLDDLKDLRAMLTYVSDNAKEYETLYGKVSSQSIGAILRSLLTLEDQGGDIFFGEPSLDLNDWFSCAENGYGYINVLNAATLIRSPQVYAMFLLWMMNDLFEILPEVGDLDKPKFVFFFDEAHLLFNDMPKALQDKIVQVVKLVRSKGVGIYFISQSPSDIPNEVLAQLSNRIQHALRAYTPAEQKTVRAAAESFRPNPSFKSEEVILELGTGEALVSFLDEEGRPSIVERAKVLPCQCLMTSISEQKIYELLCAQSALNLKYANVNDRESAYELIYGQKEQQRAEQEKLEAEEQQHKQEEEAQKAAEKEEARARKEAERAEAKAAREAELEAKRIERERQKKQDRLNREVTKVASSVIAQVGREAGRQVTRGLLGNLFK